MKVLYGASHRLRQHTKHKLYNLYMYTTRYYRKIRKQVHGSSRGESKCSVAEVELVVQVCLRN